MALATSQADAQCEYTLITQLAETTSGVQSPVQINGSGRWMVWDGTGDPLGSNPDGAPEVFLARRTGVRRDTGAWSFGM